MDSELQVLLHDALTNNTFDMNSVDLTLDKALKSSFSYLYYLQKAKVEYEEFMQNSNDVETREVSRIGHLYLDTLNFANFEVDHDIISTNCRERFRQSDFYDKFFHFDDMVDNPLIFEKIPVVLIDDKVIWDYEIMITKDGMRFKLPYRWDFVYRKYRNEVDQINYVYIDHKIQVLIIDNYFYYRLGLGAYNRNNQGLAITSNDIYRNGEIVIRKDNISKLKEYEIYSLDGRLMPYKMSPTDFKKYTKNEGIEFADPVGEFVYKINYNNSDMWAKPIYVSAPDSSQGIMMCSLHFPDELDFTYSMPTKNIINKYVKHKTDGYKFPLLEPIEISDIDIEDIEFEEITIKMIKNFEMGSMLIPLIDKGDYYSFPLTKDLQEKLTSKNQYVYISMIFMKDLHMHMFDNENKLFTMASYKTPLNGEMHGMGDIAVIEKGYTEIKDFTDIRPGTIVYYRSSQSTSLQKGTLKVDTNATRYIQNGNKRVELDGLDVYLDTTGPYNCPIPIENFIVFCKDENEKSGYHIEKNTSVLKLHYPNIYTINEDNNEKYLNNQFMLFYFYHEIDDMKFKYMNKWYFETLKNKISNFSTEKAINEIYFGYNELENMSDSEKESFRSMCVDLMNYDFEKYEYGESDYIKKNFLKPVNNISDLTDDTSVIYDRNGSLIHCTVKNISGRLILEDDENHQYDNIDMYNVYFGITPFEYKDSKMKEWIRYNPEIFHDYVLEENKVGASFYLFTNQLNLKERLRHNADLECGRRKKKYGVFNDGYLTITVYNAPSISSEIFYDSDGDYYKYNSSSNRYEYVDTIGPNEWEKMFNSNKQSFYSQDFIIGNKDNYIKPDINLTYIDYRNGNTYKYELDKDIMVPFSEIGPFTQDMYVFTLENHDNGYNDILDIRVFVDGIIVTNIYHERRIFTDYVYIPVEMVTNDSYIEIEIFPNYSFETNFEFTSLDDSKVITLINQKDDIKPTLADIFFEDRNGDRPNRISPELYDITIINNGFENAYFETVTTDTGKEMTETEILENQRKSILVERKVDGKYRYYINPTEYYKLIKQDIYGNKIYHSYNEDVFYYVLKDHKYTKYNSKGEVVEIDIPETSKNRGEMIRGKVKLYHEAVDLHKTDIEDPYPLKFANIEMIKIQPKETFLLNKTLKFKVNKNQQSIPLVTDREGYPFLEITGKNFNFSHEYIRVFVNGRLLPRCKYDFYSTMFCPRLMIYEWLYTGDLVYLDVTPYRYREVYYQEEIDTNNTVIDLNGIINKPFDTAYYDVYMNGRKLSINNIIVLSPWEIKLLNLKSQYHLTIYEKDRDWEWYGLDFDRKIYQFTLKDLMNKPFMKSTDNEEIIKSIIEVEKDYRLNIIPDTFDEIKLDYDTDFNDNTDFFVFYFYELVPKRFYNPDVRQISTEVMLENFPDIYEAYKTSPYEEATYREEADRKSKYGSVLFLDPDKCVKGRIGYFDASGGYYKYSDTHKCYIYHTKDGIKHVDNKLTEAEIFNKISTNELTAGNIMLTYIIGHPGALPQEILDQQINMNNNSNIS